LKRYTGKKLDLAEPPWRHFKVTRKGARKREKRALHHLPIIFFLIEFALAYYIKNYLLSSGGRGREKKVVLLISFF
jgi:hypothetical protein